MPAKTIKLQTGQRVTVQAVRLPSGNLVIPSRHPDDRDVATWREVAPGDADHKRWLPVAVDGPDPRERA
jgi:hypothetical protein